MIDGHGAQRAARYSTATPRRCSLRALAVDRIGQGGAAAMLRWDDAICLVPVLSSQWYVKT